MKKFINSLHAATANTVIQAGISAATVNTDSSRHFFSYLQEKPMVS
jgi:hypothetical protein